MIRTFTGDELATKWDDAPEHGQPMSARTYRIPTGWVIALIAGAIIWTGTVWAVICIVQAVHR